MKGFGDRSDVVTVNEEGGGGVRKSHGREEGCRVVRKRIGKGGEECEWLRG